MKSTFVLFVLWASFCLSATAQTTHRLPMKMDQLKKVAIQKKAPPVKPTVKKEPLLQVKPERMQHKEVVSKYYLPFDPAYSFPVKPNTTNTTPHNPTRKTPHNPIRTSPKTIKQE